MNKQVILLVGPQSAGKTTLARSPEFIDAFYINQDLQGKLQHRELFTQALEMGAEKIIVDRINHKREQRNWYLDQARYAGYSTKILVMNIPYAEAYERIQKRENHPTLKKEDAHQALKEYFSNYDYVLDDEADLVGRLTTYDPFLFDLSVMRPKPRKTLLIGDVHGCFDELQELIKKADIDFTQDRVILAGDLCDRGPKIKEVFEWAMNTPNVFVTMSNHDNKLLRKLRGNDVTSYELEKTMQQLEGIDKNKLRMWLESLPYIIKFDTDKYVVHAGINPTRPMERQAKQDLIYTREFNPETGDFRKGIASKPWYSFSRPQGARIYFGHSIHASYDVGYDDAISLDGGCVHGGVLRGVVEYSDRSNQLSHVLVIEPKEQYYVQDNELDLPKSLIPFEQLVHLGYARKAEDGDLVLYTYTDKCNYDKFWDSISIQARGIVFDKVTGECVARPFSKFFNAYENGNDPLKKLSQPYEVFEKMDGSLGIIYNYKGEWKINTKGSFKSEQAQRAKKIFDEKYALYFDHPRFSKEYTYLVEIIYPENRFNDGARLVCDYGSVEDLILLSIINTKTGKETAYADTSLIATYFKMPVVNKLYYTIEQLLLLQKTLPKTQEGFVVRFADGSRLKFKGDEYIKMNRTLNGISLLSTWDVMKGGKVPTEYIQGLPEEVRVEIEAHASALESAYAKVKQEITESAIRFEESVDVKDGEDRWKALGLAIKGSSYEHIVALFLVWRKREADLDKYIMRQIRPTGNVL